MKQSSKILLENCKVERFKLVGNIEQLFPDDKNTVTLTFSDRFFSVIVNSVLKATYNGNITMSLIGDNNTYKESHGKKN
jgi:hypothetical protein